MRIKLLFTLQLPAERRLQIGGEVVEVNQAVTDDPSLLNGDPYDAGWLVRVRAADLGPIETLLDQATYDERNPVD